ncbi:MAG: VanZ family protein [Patescibacteria group bacterium]
MKFIRYWFPAIVWMAVIFFLSSRSSVQVAQEPLINFLFFKTLHVIEYSILFFLYVRALRSSFRFGTSVTVFVMAFVLTILYAGTDEIHQLYVPTREGKFRDVIIDAIGAGGVWIFLGHVVPRAPKKLRILAKNLGMY